MKRIGWIVAWVTSLAFVQSGNAQSAGRSGRDAVTERFEENAPDIGELIPDLTVYGAGGQKQSLQALLQGHYTVLVLGCLT
ncbi:MAG: hypothetical protein ACE5G2_01515 [Candidatus Krumholzibacteriia bacterium]